MRPLLGLAVKRQGAVPNFSRALLFCRGHGKLRSRLFAWLAAPLLSPPFPLRPLRPLASLRRRWGRGEAFRDNSGGGARKAEEEAKERSAGNCSTMRDSEHVQNSAPERSTSVRLEGRSFPGWGLGGLREVNTLFVGFYGNDRDTGIDVGAAG